MVRVHKQLFWRLLFKNGSRITAISYEYLFIDNLNVDYVRYEEKSVIIIHETSCIQRQFLILLRLQLSVLFKVFYYR